MEDMVTVLVNHLCSEVFNISSEEIYNKRITRPLSHLKDYKHITIYLLYKYKIVKNQEDLATLFNYDSRSMVSNAIKKILTTRNDWLELTLFKANQVILKFIQNLNKDFKGPIRREYVIITGDVLSDIYKFNIIALALNTPLLVQNIKYNGLIFKVERFNNDSNVYININLN